MKPHINWTAVLVMSNMLVFMMLTNNGIDYIIVPMVCLNFFYLMWNKEETQ